MLQAQRIDPAKLASLDEVALRELAGQLIERIDRDAREIHWRDAKIEKLTFEMAQLRRVKFGVKSEQLDAQQKTLFEEAVDADMAAIEAQIVELKAGIEPQQVDVPDRPSAHRCRRICRASSGITNRRARLAPAAAR